MKWPLILGCSLFSSISCQHQFTGNEAERDDAILGARRAASLDSWKTGTMQGTSPANYAILAMAVVLPPDAQVDWQTNHASGTTTFSFKATGRELQSGSAVPITADGYFLTAAHCTDDFSHVLIGAPVQSETFAFARARVVWRSKHMEEGGDFALLHAPLSPYMPLTLSPPDTLRIGTPVLVTGYSSTKPAPAAGKILSLSETESDASGASWRRIGHSAPILSGDSGGPVIGSEGQLLGITTSIHYRFAFPFGIRRHFRYQGIAIAPDTEWIQSIIRKDRTTRGNR